MPWFILAVVCVLLHQGNPASPEELAVMDFLREQLADLLIAINQQWLFKVQVLAYQPSDEMAWLYFHLVDRLQRQLWRYDITIATFNEGSNQISNYVTQNVYGDVQLLFVMFPGVDTGMDYLKRILIQEYPTLVTVGVFPENAELPDLTKVKRRMKPMVGFYVVTKGARDLEYRMEEVYTWNPKDSITVNEIGRKAPGERWVLSKIPIWTRRRDMNGTSLKIRTPAWEENNVDTVVDLGTDVWKIIEETTKVRAEILMDEVEHENVVGKVTKDAMEGKLDFSPFLVSETAQSFGVRASHAITGTVYKIFVRQPAFVYSWKAYFDGISWNLWKAIIASLIILPACSFAIHGIYRRNGLENKTLELTDSYLLMIGKVCLQGCSFVPSSMAPRIVFFVSLVFGYLIYQTYTSVLMSNITARNWQLPFTSLENILRRDDYLIQTVKERTPDEAADYLSKWDELMKIFYRRLLVENDSYIDDTYEAFDRVCKEKAVLFISEDLTSFDPRKIPCKIVSLPITYFKERLIFVGYESFKCMSIFSEIIKKLEEGGILEYLRRKWRPRRDTEETESLLPIEMAQVKPIFFVYMVSVGVSLFLVLVEICSWKCCHRSAKQKETQAPPPYSTLYPERDNLYLPFYKGNGAKHRKRK